jgi:hypothetical protein
MKRIKIIRILIGLNLIIFLLPFFNTCSNTPLRKENKKILESIKHSKLSAAEKIQFSKDEQQRFESEKSSNDRHVMNAYQLAYLSVKDPDLKMFKEPYFYFSLCYLFQIISIMIMIFLSIKNKIRKVKWMTLMNLAILFLGVLISIIGNLFEHLDQLKIGFYVYLLNLMIIYSLVLVENKE